MSPYASILLWVDHVGSVLPMILLMGCGTTGTRLNCMVSKSPAVGFGDIHVDSLEDFYSYRSHWDALQQSNTHLWVIGFGIATHVPNHLPYLTLPVVFSQLRACCDSAATLQTFVRWQRDRRIQKVALFVASCLFLFLV